MRSLITPFSLVAGSFKKGYTYCFEVLGARLREMLTTGGLLKWSTIQECEIDYSWCAWYLINIHPELEVY